MLGFLNINKPVGPSSHAIVNHVRRQAGRGIKVGHAGTLDPFAQGVLVVCLGAACRLAEYVQAQYKEYRTEIILGAASDTDDVRGVITPTPGASAPSDAAIAAAVRAQIGTIQQVPPDHSAVHVEGQRAYHLARAGQAVSLTARPVDILDVRVLEYRYPILDIEVACGSGTYIRSIARDIGRALGIGGYCAKLVRTRIGPFRIEQAGDPDSIRIPQDVIAPSAGLPDFPTVRLDQRDILTVRYGKTVALTCPAVTGEVAITDTAGQWIALGEVSADGLTVKPVKVFVGPPV